MSCKWTERGHVLRTHRHDCRANDCPGCEPCTNDANGNPVRHCGIRRRCTEHLEPGEYACPKCLGLIRGNMREIVECMAAMPHEAVFAGIESEAANLAGPHADVIVASWRLVNLSRQGVDKIEELDELDPYTALSRRERMIREDYGHDSDILCSPTLSGAVKYIDLMLTRMARDEQQTLVVAELMDVTAKVRGHVEAVLHASRSPERGAPCTICAPPAPRLRKRFLHYDLTGASDVWECPADPNGHWWYEAEYRLWVTDDYLANASRLTAEQMEKAHGIKPGSLTGWAAKVNDDGRPLVRKRGKDQRGRVLYDVADALAAKGA